MILTEFNEDVFVNGIRQEGIEQGIEQGREQGIVEGRAEGIENCIINLMENLKCTREDAMRFLNVAEEK